jgi:hypothetical protein
MKRPITWIGGPRDGLTFEGEGLIGSMINAVDEPELLIGSWADPEEITDPSDLVTIRYVTYRVMRRADGTLCAVHPTLTAAYDAGKLQ